MRRFILALFLCLLLVNTAESRDKLVFRGVAINNDNPDKPVSAEIIVSLDQQGNCVLKVGAPLYGSGSCAWVKYDDKTGALELESKGPLYDITWTGVAAETVKGTYRVTSPALPVLPQQGTFELSIDDTAQPLALSDVLTSEKTAVDGKEYILWLDRDIVSFHNPDGSYAGVRVFLDEKGDPSLIAEDFKNGSTYRKADTDAILLTWIFDGKSGYYTRTTNGVSEYLDKYLEPTGWSSVVSGGKTIFMHEDSSGTELFDESLKSLGIRWQRTTSGKEYWTSTRDGVTEYFDASFNPLKWYSFQSNGQTVFAHEKGKKIRYYDANMNEIRIPKRPGFWSQFARGMAIGLSAYGQALREQEAAQTQHSDSSYYPSPLLHGSTTTQQLGQFGYSTTTDPSGDSYSTTSQRIGQFTYSNTIGSNGYSANSTTQHIGDFGYTNGTSTNGSFSGNSQTIGAFTFQNLESQGVSISGTSQQIGNFTYHNFTTSTGQTITGTTQRIGDFIYTDLH